MTSTLSKCGAYSILQISRCWHPGTSVLCWLRGGGEKDYCPWMPLPPLRHWLDICNYLQISAINCILQISDIWIWISLSLCEECIVIFTGWMFEMGRCVDCGDKLRGDRAIERKHWCQGIGLAERANGKRVKKTDVQQILKKLSACCNYKWISCTDCNYYLCVSANYLLINLDIL